MVNSVILENIETLKKSIQDKIYYKDLNYMGLDKNGNISCSNQACTLQELKIWLQSGIYDFHRRPNHGGFFEREVIKKPFKQDSCAGIIAKLKLEVAEKFPYIQLTNVELICNINMHRWELKIAATDTRTGLSDSMFESGQTITWNA